MDPVRNPFAPGAGSPPPELAGRTAVLNDASVALQRLAAGRAAQSVILVGLRGVGKTVLLNAIEAAAEKAGHSALMMEAHEGKRLAALLVPRLRELLMRLSRIERAREQANRGLRVLKSFVGAVKKLKVGDIELELGIEAEQGTADSGDLEADLPSLLLSVAEAARAAGTAATLLIDEMQYLEEKEFSALIMSVHRINQKGLPLVLMGAGLPQILALAGDSKSYAERLFSFPAIGALDTEDARSAIRAPVEQSAARIEEAALHEILEQSRCYPYFLQQWGYESWNMASGATITRQDVERATLKTLGSLDQSFFRVRVDRCKPSEKRYMRALAELGPGEHRSGAIAELLGLKVTSVGPTRASLIRKGMLYSPAHGDNTFTVPMFDEFMRREMPQMPER